MSDSSFTWQSHGTWRKPCIVHVTMVAKNRQPLFGTLIHTGEKADVEKSQLGWVLINEQKRLEKLCPEIRIIADKVMPDHHHIVLQVTQEMTRSIKEVVRSYMQGCKASARLLGYTEPLYDGPPFFRVLTHRGQLVPKPNATISPVGSISKPVQPDGCFCWNRQQRRSCSHK